MRLSTAMMLGDVLRERDGSLYLTVSGGRACGCAIGGAYLAIGRTRVDHQTMSEFPWLMDIGPDGQNCWTAQIGCGVSGISFNSVMRGDFTFEQLVDYVRSVEPSCGDCNKFDCSCVQKMDVTPTYNTVTEEAVCTNLSSFSTLR